LVLFGSNIGHFYPFIEQIPVKTMSFTMLFAISGQRVQQRILRTSARLAIFILASDWVRSTKKALFVFYVKLGK
jgi:hypothetical protein